MKKTKLQITMPDDMVARIDKIASEMGMTRSQLCAYFIGSSVRQAELQTDAISAAMNTLVPVFEQVLKDGNDGKLVGK